MEIKRYEPAHESGCLSLLASNTPAFFSDVDRANFEKFLQAPNCEYFVMEHDGAIVGCGGYYLTDSGRSARLVWGMVRADLHGQGLGRYLLLYRLKQLSGVQTVELDTTAAAAGFFTKQGFKTVAIEKDGYGAGVDRVSMSKKMVVCT